MRHETSNRHASPPAGVARSRFTFHLRSGLWPSRNVLQSATFRVLYVPFIRRLFSMQQVVIGPLGNPLTLADLPRPGTLRWVARRKAEVVAAVEGGLLSTETACAMYTLSLDELLSWQQTLARRGIRALRIRTLSERQHRYSIR